MDTENQTSYSCSLFFSLGFFNVNEDTDICNQWVGFDICVLKAKRRTWQSGLTNILWYENQSMNTRKRTPEPIMTRTKGSMGFLWFWNVKCWPASGFALGWFGCSTGAHTQSGAGLRPTKDETRPFAEMAAECAYKYRAGLALSALSPFKASSKVDTVSSTETQWPAEAPSTVQMQKMHSGPKFPMSPVGTTLITPAETKTVLGVRTPQPNATKLLPIA